MINRTLASIILIMAASCTPLPPEPVRHIDALYWEYRLDSRSGTVRVDHRGAQRSVDLQLSDAEFDKIFHLADSLDFWSITPDSGMYGSYVDPDPGAQFVELIRGERRKRVIWEGYAHATEMGNRLGPIWAAIGHAMQSHEQFKNLPTFVKF